MIIYIHSKVNAGSKVVRQFNFGELEVIRQKPFEGFIHYIEKYLVPWSRLSDWSRETNDSYLPSWAV